MTFNENHISFQGIDAAYSEVLFTIHRDGRITIADHLTVDDAAREFWTAVRRMNPYPPTLDHEQRVRVVVAKLMSHYGYAQTNPEQDVLQLQSPRARAWVSLARAIVDALFAGQEG
ncbi:hypothetical protein [Burkholderia pseudomultivorans]|uniref:hypothetical protein n=1 Tax=Burkholderia pseudomultivorans TaxID=1207504 RepID=UPI000751E516|nr:hypothetical protein [Burkholderia pseudomultivorans]KWF09563.1 hypothetical protein WT55_16705 [Burkholderia pseudomultivorans]